MSELSELREKRMEPGTRVHCRRKGVGIVLQADDLPPNQVMVIWESCEEMTPTSVDELT